MENAKIRCWIKTHNRMKLRLALRTASVPSERWIVKAAEWNPELSSRYKTNSAIGRPRRRWEDDINEILKFKENETENSTESENKYNKSWINAAKDRGKSGLYLKTITQRLQKKDLKIMPARYHPRKNTNKQF